MGQAVAAPGRAPAIFGDQFLKRPVEIVGILHRRLDVVLAEHGGTNLETLVEPGFVHGDVLYNDVAAPLRVAGPRRDLLWHGGTPVSVERTAIVNRSADRSRGAHISNFDTQTGSNSKACRKVGAPHLNGNSPWYHKTLFRS